MSSTMKRRRVIAYQSRLGSDVINIYMCGDCQCYFPSLQTIHSHYKSCVDNLNITSCRSSDSSLVEPPSGLKPVLLHSSNSETSLLKGTSSSTTPKSKHSDKDQLQWQCSKTTAEPTSNKSKIHSVLDDTSGEISVDLCDSLNECPDLLSNEITESFTVSGRSHIDVSHDIPFECLEILKKKQTQSDSTDTEIKNELINTCNEIAEGISSTIHTQQGNLGEIKTDSLNISESSGETSGIFPSKNEQNIKRFGNKRHSYVEENETTFKSLGYSYQMSDDNVDISDLSGRKSSIENIHKYQRNDRDSSDDNDEETVPCKDETLMVWEKGKRSYYVSEEMALVHSSSKNRTLPGCRERDPRSKGLGSESMNSEVPDLLKLCGNTEKCITSVLSGNMEEEVISDKEINSNKEKEKFVSNQQALSEKVCQEISLNTNQELDRCQNVDCNNETKLNTASDMTKRQTPVLVTYNENENTDLNLECENIRSCIGSDLSDEKATLVKTKSADFQLDSRKENRGPSLNGQALNIGQFNLKRLSVTVERLDMSLFKKRKNDESYALQNESDVTVNVDKGNIHTFPEVKNEQCQGISRHFRTATEAVAKSFLSDSSVQIFNEDNKLKGCRKIKTSSRSHFEECKTDKTEHQMDLVKEDLEEGSGESSEKSEHCYKCKTHFTSLTCYINHLLLFHHPAYTRKNLTMCPICPHTLYDSYFNSSLKSHARFAHELDELKCLRCKMKFDTYIDLHDHIKACRAKFPVRPLSGSLFYTKSVQCNNCKTFHIYRPSNNKRDILKDIIQTLPDDHKLNFMKEKDKKLHENTAKHTSKDNLKCRLCNIRFNRLSCGLNHAITVHMKETLKTRCSLFKKTQHILECGLCSETHKVTFLPSRKRITRLLLPGKKIKDSSDKLNSNDQKILQMIRDGLCTYYGYKKDKRFNVKLTGDHFCKTCDTSFGPFLCGLNHMLKAHFNRNMIDIAKKSSFFDTCRRESNCRLKTCKKRHYFSVSDIHQLKHCLANPACTESTIIKKLQEVLVNNTSKHLHLQYMTARVNVVAAKTKEEISRDMEYRIAYKNGIFLCRLCHSEYNKYSCCKCHVLTEHGAMFSYRTGSEVYTCPECKKHFHKLHFLDVHLKINHSIYRFTCLKCEEHFTTYSEYNTHVRHGKNIIQTNFNEKLSCKECGLIHSCAVQDGEAELIISLSSENDTTLKYVKTNSVKQEKHQNRSDATAHSENENDSHSDVAFDGKKFVCLVCLEKFEKLTCCFTHTVMQHYKLGDYLCSICFQTSRMKAIHISHLRNSHGLDAYYCRHCHAGFEEEFIRDKHAEDCHIQTNKILENVDENLCHTCFGVHIHMSEDDKSLLPCKECILGFASVGCARNHFYIKHFPAWVILASQENVFKCHCGKDVLTKSELMLHLKSAHPLKQNVSEQGIPKQKESLEKVQNIGTDYDNYFKEYDSSAGKCVACEHVHIISSKSGTIQSSKEKTCKVCQKSFFTPKCLRNHMLVAHADGFQPRQCVGCSLYFGGLRALKYHQGDEGTLNAQNLQGNEQDVERICRRNVNIVKCTDCDEIHQHQFSTEEKKLKNASSPNMIREERLKFKESSKNVYKCSICGLLFANNRDLVAHRSSDHGKINDEKGAICKICSQKIDSNQFYSDHLKQEHYSFRLVDGEFFDDFCRNISCVYCNKTFSFLMDVQLHLRSKHFEKPLVARKHYRPELEGFMRNGFHVLQCPLCFKIGSKSIPVHINSHFNKLSLNENKYVCDICGKCFANKLSLDVHKDCHTEIRKFKCNLCEKSFLYRPNLDAHSLVHKEKKEMCKICGMKFTLPHHVRAHVKRKHPDHV